MSSIQPTKLKMKKEKPVTRKHGNVERPPKKPRILVFDIETSPNLVYTFGLFNQNIGLDKVIKETGLLSLSWKFLGDPQTYYKSIPITQEDKWDDREICEFAYKLLSSVDAVIGHNICKFDLPVLRGRFYHHGLPPLKPLHELDTLTMSRHAGKHLSRKLAHLTKGLEFTKLSHAKFPGFELWSEFMAGNPEAAQEMEDYNRMDVISNEALFNRLRPYSRVFIPGTSRDGDVCPKCGSSHIQKRGVHETLTGWYQRYRCNDCGGWSQSRFTHRPTSISKSKLKAV